MSVGYGGPIIDMHAHVMLDAQMQMSKAPHAPRDYVAAADGLDVRHVGALAIAPVGDLDRCRAQNDLILDLSNVSPIFFAVASVHPHDGAAALAEIDRVVRAGARCLKLHPNTQRFDVADPAVHAVVAHATERGLPVLFDAYWPFDPAQPGKFVELAMAAPEARLILAHAYGPSFAQLLVYDVLAKYPWWARQVWVDLSMAAPMFAGGPYAEQFAWVCAKIGTDRLLFGSDYPLALPGETVDAVCSLGFSDSDLDAILFRNAATLFGLD